MPLVVLRRRGSDRDFHGKAVPFAATALLRPVAAFTPAQLSALPHGTVIGVLELYDPLRVEKIALWQLPLTALARNTSAPFALVVEQVNRDNWQAFLRPGQNGADAELRMLEPYQRGKIPSCWCTDSFPTSSPGSRWPTTCGMSRGSTNATRSGRFSTRPVSRSCSRVRICARHSATFRESSIPCNVDPAQQYTVLIGHSMGGLVSKLQVTHSGTLLWDQVASRPLSEIRAEPQQRDELYKMFFFEPLPSVKRVVFIGTPHLGSFWAESLYGRLGSSLVRMPQTPIRDARLGDEGQHQRLQQESARRHADQH